MVKSIIKKWVQINSILVFKRRTGTGISTFSLYSHTEKISEDHSEKTIIGKSEWEPSKIKTKGTWSFDFKSPELYENKYLGPETIQRVKCFLFIWHEFYPSSWLDTHIVIPILIRTNPWMKSQDPKGNEISVALLTHTGVSYFSCLNKLIHWSAFLPCFLICPSLSKISNVG